MQRTTGNSYKKELTDINTVESLAQPGRPYDLFAFKINYNQVEDNASNGVVSLYNGNISETFWRSYNDNVLRNYGYTYDALNRLEEAFYQKPGYTQPNVNNYREKLTYDPNGNITHLWRNGELDATNLALEIDDLTYTYAPDSNLLLKVTDATASPAGFQDDVTDGTLASDSTDDYLYDAMGNMIQDENKSIQTIAYNHLNLPTFIDFGWRGTITYLYDATGRKVRKVVQNNVLSQNIVTDYANGFQYENNIVQFFPTAEGYATRLTTKIEETGRLVKIPIEELPEDQFSYVYNYTDHLGNIRLSYAQDPDTQQLKIVEQNHYYPFGLRHTNYSGGKMQVVKDQEFKRMAPTPEALLSYKYKYNGKEWQDELGLNMYDYGARNYDAALGRWMNVDPKAETSRRWNPYTYCYNNPMRFVDPDGMIGQDWVKKGGQWSWRSDVNSPEEAAKKGYTDYSDGRTNNVVDFDGNGRTITLKENAKWVDSSNGIEKTAPDRAEPTAIAEAKVDAGNTASINEQGEAITVSESSGTVLDTERISQVSSGIGLANDVKSTIITAAGAIDDLGNYSTALRVIGGATGAIQAIDSGANIYNSLSNGQAPSLKDAISFASGLVSVGTTFLKVSNPVGIAIGVAQIAWGVYTAIDSK